MYKWDSAIPGDPYPGSSCTSLNCSEWPLKPNRLAAGSDICPSRAASKRSCMTFVQQLPGLVMQSYQLETVREVTCLLGQLPTTGAFAECTSTKG